MKKKYGIKFLFDMRGFWVDERVEGGLWNLANPLYKSIYKYFKKKEKAFIESADHIISLTENAKSEIELWKLKAAQISVIPTCVDIELFNPKKINHQEKNALKKKLGIGQDDFVLIYLGSWGTWYLTDEMLRFYAQLKKRELNAKFLIISADAEAQRYRGKDIIVRRCNRSEVPAFISIANLSVAFVQPTYSKKASSATKIGEIIAMGIPVVTNQGWGDIQTYNNQGVTIATNFDEEELDMSIVKAMPNAANERNTLLEKLSLATGIKQYLKVYEGLSVTF